MAKSISIPKQPPKKSSQPAEEKVKRSEAPETWATSIPFYFRISTKQKIFFFKYMAVMIGAGIPLESALQTLHKQSKSIVMHRVIHNMIDDVSSGEFLSSTMEQMPHIFDPLHTSLVSVGEASGSLTQEMFNIAEHLEKSRELKNKVLSAMLYPAIVISGTVGVAFYMMFVLIPQLTPLFTSLNVELPRSTKTVIAMSNFMTANGILLVLGLIAITIAFSLLLRIRSFRKKAQYLLLKVPLFGQLMLKVQIALFTRIVGTLLGSGLTIVKSVDITARSVNNLVYKDALTTVARSIEEGSDFTNYLSKHPFLFPPFVTQMISVGEETGKLHESFLYVADFAEREVDETTKTLTTIMEPLFLIILGGIVGFLAISVITPVYKLTEGLQR